jgi:hypothetical protein
MGGGLMYEIVRFHRGDTPSTVVKVVDTLEEAKEWCSRDDTHGDDWFDGFREIPDYGLGGKV